MTVSAQALFRLTLLTATFTVAGWACAQQPPDVVVSDQFSNTASGSGALSNLSVGSAGGRNNSAFGHAALVFDTTGSFNTAVGEGALSFSTGSSNTGIGAGALMSNTNDNNTAV